MRLAFGSFSTFDRMLDREASELGTSFAVARSFVKLPDKSPSGFRIACLQASLPWPVGHRREADAYQKPPIFLPSYFSHVVSPGSRYPILGGLPPFLSPSVGITSRRLSLSR